MDERILAHLRGNDRHADQFESRFDDVQESQRPDMVTVACSDSRVLQDHGWGNERPGAIFTVGNVGNRVVQRTASETVVSGDVLYPLLHTGTETVAVVGHTGCGAVTATYDAVTDEPSGPPGIRHCVELLTEAIGEGVDRLPDGFDRATAVNHLVEYNVDRQVDYCLESGEVPDEVTILGLVYDFQDVYDGRRGELHVVNVDGERDPERLRTDHEAVADRVSRLWTY
ncbi:carbonic anhydrase [Halobaculum sp. MBLA0147]|uniref:carbonic anhydrase n=1 Tax=Halobaculum sp. MBLA0147 TaxID=3079934 RepID=UPI0035249846